MVWAGPDLPMPRSATSDTSVIKGAVTLFVGSGSPVSELTPATLVNEPLGGAVTVNVRLNDWPLVSNPSDQMIVPLSLVPPSLALTNVTPAGSVSVTTTPAASDGPRLVMLMM